MWFLANHLDKRCEAVRDRLELGVNRPETGRIVAPGALLSSLPADLREHIGACGDCRIFAEELLQVRALLQSGGGPQQTTTAHLAQPGPFFIARVMASIAGREAEQEKKVQTWAAVPRLAHRLTVLASVTLLLAASWLYQRPVAQSSTVAGISAEQNSEGLVDGGSAIQDDFLLSAADR